MRTDRLVVNNDNKLDSIDNKDKDKAKATRSSANPSCA